jgi:type II restriction/modification system DNA methylase subunit YeeA
MNQSALKKFAIQARKDLIEQVGARLRHVLSADSVELREKATQVNALRKALDSESKQALVDRVAYTWFNRLAALRFMDAHEYHPFGCRVVTAIPGQTQPEILQQVRNGMFPEGLEVDKARINGLLDGKVPSGNPQAEVYRTLFVAACNFYNAAMPFLFERIEDYTELLLPADLLSDASVAAGFRTEISDEDCTDVEIIGWLYQYYISEKKDEVIGKVVKSEDIPAATQLFTPNWIVKYMVQNSLGAQWLATYPDSPLKGQMEYYIEPAEQTDEVNAQLAAITPSQLNPEELTLIDPACGSGHILVEAYELFKAIYLERGYRQRDIPKLIFEKNLYGLDIDERAAQLTGFALMMKGRADDRRLFEREVTLNVMALVDSVGFDAEALADSIDLSEYDLKLGILTELKRLFENTMTFGSLIQVPAELASSLSALNQLSELTNQDLFVSEAIKHLVPLVQQAALLADQYDAVVANPPYMGGKFFCSVLKTFAKDCYSNAKSDLFACFIDRGYTLAKSVGHISMVTMESWMFLSSYEQFRSKILQQHTLRNLAHFPYDGKRPTAMGINFGVTVLSSQKTSMANYQGHYCCSRYYELNDDGTPFEFPTRNERLKIVAASEFEKIPGSPVAYWAESKSIESFRSQRVGAVSQIVVGLQPGDTERFIRCWHEVELPMVGFGYTSTSEATSSGMKWFPYNKGGDYRKWAGNAEFIVNWQYDGQEVRTCPSSRPQNTSYYFRPAVVCSGLTSGLSSFRHYPAGFVIDVNIRCAYADSDIISYAISGFGNSIVARHFMGILNPTLAFNVSQFQDLPLPDSIDNASVRSLVMRILEVSEIDWNAYERSWDFENLPLLTVSTAPAPTLESSYTAWITQNRDTIAEMKRLEEENNRLFIDAYGLQDELTPDVPIEQITLTVNPAYRYGVKLTEEQQWSRFRQDTMEELVSYAVGCMMGRYSLDAPGLILADTRDNQDEHLAAYLEKVGKPMEGLKFQPDADNIIPILDGEWFEDDIVTQFTTFLKAAFDGDSFDENLRFLEGGLGKKIRKYFVNDFYKSHVQTYKKRPIYWLFSSPKKSFQALVYLHRYNRDTVNVLLNDYLREFQGKLRNRRQHLHEILASESTTARETTSANKELEKLNKSLTELEDWEREVILPLAQQRIEIDLDDGVKQNYPKFGKALANIPGFD